jgi:hypothetical protein
VKRALAGALLALALGACRAGPEAESSAGDPVDPAQREAVQGVSPEELRERAQPMTPEEARELGVVDTTVQVADEP